MAPKRKAKANATPREGPSKQARRSFTQASSTQASSTQASSSQASSTQASSTQASSTQASSKRASSKRASSTRASSTLQRSSSNESEHIKSLDFLNTSTSKFKKRDILALNISYKPATSMDDVIPAFEGELPDFPKEYVGRNFDYDMLISKDFNIEYIDSTEMEKEVKTFFFKLSEVALNGRLTIGTRESYTDTLVDDLLRITGFNKWPLMIRNHYVSRIFIEGEPYVSSDPEFVISKPKMAMLVVEDKHLRNVNKRTAFGELQIAGEIIALGDENTRLNKDAVDEDQVIFAMRVISTCVTFYKAEIPGEYWEELGEGLPKDQSVEILRWPAGNGEDSGYDLADPDDREAVLKALVEIREYMLSV